MIRSFSPWLGWLYLVLVVCSTSAEDAADLPAFPGAEGFGAHSVGGRGGRVLEVTNLNDRGLGSLRAAVEAKGRRLVVFRVAGTIELNSELVLTNPYITIAGQTAPGDGITLKTHPSNSRSALTIKGGHDVVIRYLRIRPGRPTERKESGDDSYVQDALQILDASRVIIDHCSFSWAADEVVSTWFSARDVTIGWCVISEALVNAQYGRPDGKGLLIGSKDASRISVHHNLLVHNVGRNPMIKAQGLVDVTNNVVLAPRTVAMSVDGEYGPTPVNAVCNYVLAPHGDGLVYGVRVLGEKPVSLFVQGNIGPFRSDDHQAEERFVKSAGSIERFLVAKRHPAPPVTTASASEAYQRVMLDAGCTRPQRDAVDQRILSDVRERRCRLVKDPAEVGGWPELAHGTAPVDSDHDAMPDEWERNHKFDPTDASDGVRDADGDGYTNVEEYLNRTDPRQKESRD